MSITLSFTFNKSDLSGLETFLSSRSYVEGFAPSAADAALAKAIGSADAAKFPNVARFLSHINSFNAAAQGKWAAGAATIGSGAAPAGKAAAAKPADDDDDIDLFGSDDEEEVAALEAKKKADAAKPKKVVIAKSNIIWDVKPWDDETNMKELEENVRSFAMDGLVWGASKLVAVGYGIKKLQITSVVEDDKVSTDDIEEALLGFEDHVQSVDIVAFNKV